MLVDIVGLLLAQSGTNNMPLFHIITFVELLIFTSLYAKDAIGFRRNLILFLGSGGLLFLIVNVFVNEGILEFNSSARFVQALIILSFTVIWFIEVFQNLREESLTKDPIFFVTSGVLIYFTGSAVIFGLYNELLQSQIELLKMLWDVHAVLNIILNISIFIALFKLKNKLPQEFSSEN